MNIALKNIAAFCTALALSIGTTAARAEENPAFMKFHTTGDFETVLANVKQSLEVSQFVVNSEQNLSKALEINQHLFPNGTWNTIGFKNVTAVHFCSLVFNQRVFNMNIDWSILCPFKLVVYSMEQTPRDITVIAQRPTYLLAKDPDPNAETVGATMEERISKAIKDGLSH